MWKRTKDILCNGGAPKFTKEPENPTRVVEGDNITLEWRYTFGESESFLSMTFEKGRIRMVTKFLNSLFIANLYESRLRV